MRYVTFLLAGCVVSAAISARAEPQPVLIAQNAEHFVHAVPLGEGHALVHTSPATAVMKSLLVVRPYSRKEHEAAQQPQEAVPAAAGIVVDGFDQRIVGITSDPQRLYVLVAGKTTTPLIPQEPRRVRLPVVRTRYMLHVFWRATGARIHSQELAVQETDKELPEAALTAGPLQQVKNGVSCLGYRFEFARQNLVRYQDNEGRTITLPVFTRDPDRPNL